MECMLCKNETKTLRKGKPICQQCVKDAQGARDHLNSTRTNPMTKMNTLGEKPITTNEILQEYLLKQYENNLDGDEK